MKLYFLRHGIAADREEWDGRDFDRPLTREGEERMARESKTIARLDLSLDAILTSPLLRAKQTAEIVASPLKMRVVEDARLGGDFDAKILREMLRERADAKSLMIVGHEPNFSETIADIVGGGRIDLKKGGLAYVDLDGNLSGQLVWLIPPKVLAG